MKFILLTILFISTIGTLFSQKIGNGVTDVEGNQYQTVIIGGQEWMKENLKTSKYNDGSSIPNVTDSASWVSLTTGAWVHYKNDEKFNSIYGKLYNGFVIRKDKNVCPTGWHIPKAIDWKELVDFLGGDEIAGEKLKEVDTLLWYSPYEASKMDIQTTLPTNTSLFSARPGGVVYNRWGFDGMRWGGFWWGADPQFSNDTTIAYLVNLNHSNNLVQYADKNKKNGFSIRCLKDQVEGTINSIDCEKKMVNGFILEQTEVSNVTIELPYFGGNGGNINQIVINSSGIEGLVATLNKGFLKEGDSSLSFTLSGKTAGYGVAVFDLNFLGQTCNVEVPIEQILGKYGAGVADVDGNQYETVIIGDQEWMGENLKTTKYNDGQIIRNLVENDLWQTDSIGGWCNYQNDQSFDEIYGKLYNWQVINPKFNKNVCPVGWHVPTVKDWGDLIQYLGDAKSNGHPDLSIDIYDSNKGGLLKSTDYWMKPNVGANNSTYFNGLPAGLRERDGKFLDIQKKNFFWSQSELNKYNYLVFSISLSSDVTELSNGNNSEKSNGYSIRCIKDSPNLQGNINSLECDSATFIGQLLKDQSAQGMSFKVPYSGGNSGTYNEQNITSTGVAGLTATLKAGNFENGNGVLTYEVSGTPISRGVASFEINIGGKTCTIHQTVCGVIETIDSVQTCEKYAWKGKWLVTSGSYSDTLRSQNGCDTIQTLVLSIIPSQNRVDSITACDPYVWYDSTYSESGTYTHTYQNVHGCTLTDTLVLLYSKPLNLVITGDSVVRVGDSIRWTSNLPGIWGLNSTYHVKIDSLGWIHGLNEGDAEVTLYVNSDLGCGNHKTKSLKVLPAIDPCTEVKNKIDSLFVCQSVEWNGELYSQSGVYAKTYQTSLGCTVTDTLVLNVYPSENKIDTLTVCGSAEWHGARYSVSGVYSKTYQNTYGCSVTDTLILEIKPSQNRVDSITACDPYVWYDSTYSESGTYTHTYQNVHGCTLTDTLVLLYSKPLNLVITGDSVVRVGDSIRWTSNLPGIWGLNSTYHVKIDSLGWIHGLNEGDAEVTLYVNSDLGCGNHKTKSLKILPAIDPCTEVKNKIDSLFVCQSVEWNGELYSQSGVYAKTYQTSLGCTVTDTLVLNVYPSENKIDTLTVCGSAEWHGARYSVSGVYSKTYQNTYGCSVTDTLILEIKPSQNRVDSITACDPYVWYDSTYSESGTYTHTYQNVHGCTLTDTLVLLYSKPLNLVITGDSVVRVGDSIRWTSNLPGIWGLNSTYHVKIDSLGWIHGLNEGDAEVTLYVNSDLGCGNHKTKSLKVLPAIDPCTEVKNKIDSLFVCQSVEWNGELYSQSGVYAKTYQTSLGCTVTDTLVLNVYPSENKIDTLTVCGSAEWHGARYSVSGVYSKTYQNTYGCSVTDTLILEIKPSQNRVDSITACDPYVWYDSTYSESGTYTHTYQNVHGCTLTDTLVLLYSKPLNLVITGDSVVRVGDSIRWTSNLPGIWGLNSTYHVKIDSLGWIHGLNEGDAEVTLYVNSDLGCGNHKTKSLKVLPAIDPCTEVKNKIDSLFVCQSVEWNGELYSQSGVYAKTYQTSLGCTVTDTLVLNVYPSENKIDTLTVCGSAEWHGARYSVSGVYSKTYQNTYGCSVTDTLILEIKPSQNRVDSITACDPYVWYDSTYSESGTYTHTYQNVHGCTLTDTLVLLYSKPLNLVITGDSVVRVGDSIRWTSNLPGIWGLNSTYHVKIDSLGWIHGLNEGDAEITLYVNSDLGCGNHKTKSLKVLPAIDICKDFYAVVSSFVDNTSDSSICNGKIQIEQKGGKLPVSYLWNTGLTKPIGESLCEGDYLITLTDANLCSTVLKTTISNVSTIETTLDIEVTTMNASSVQSCDGSVAINVKNGTAPFYFDNVIYSAYLRNSLCAGLYTVEVSDAKGLKSTLPYLISAPETTINTENKLLKDSISVDTIKTTLLKNCDIDLTKVDSVKIKEYLPIDNSMVVITWGIYSKNTTQFVSQKYKVDKGTGVYTALLEMYCKEEKRQIPSLQVVEKFYFRSTGNSTASVIQKEQLNNLRVYPNPFTDEVVIGLDQPQDFQLEIIGVDGNRLFIDKYTNQKTVRLNLGELANGVYLVKVSNSNFVQEKMIIK